MGDTYINVAIGYVLEVPFLTVTIIAVGTLGRKRPLVGCYVIVAVSSLVVIPLEWSKG